MIIGGLQKTSLIDFPKCISAIIFTQGCNFRCRYCHNPELLSYTESKYSEEEILDFLNIRKGKLDGVVITGGEPTLQKDLKEFIRKIKDMGYKVKLDTNGTNPDMIKELLNDNLLDYIAMDIKAPLDKYEEIINIKNSYDIKNSINIIMNSNTEYEFRTTVLKKLLTIDDFEKIGDLITGAKKYYVQKFVSTKILDKTLENELNYTNEEFDRIINLLKNKIEFVGLR